MPPDTAVCSDNYRAKSVFNKNVGDNEIIFFGNSSIKLAEVEGPRKTTIVAIVFIGPIGVWESSITLRSGMSGPLI